MMLNKGSNPEGIGQITSGIESGNLVVKTIDFVHQQLPRWRDDPDRPTEYSEERLNSQLSKFLDARARSEFPMVYFQREEFQTGRRRADVSALPSEPTLIGGKAYSIYEPFLVLEG